MRPDLPLFQKKSINRVENTRHDGTKDNDRQKGQQEPAEHNAGKKKKGQKEPQNNITRFFIQHRAPNKKLATRV